MKNVISRNLFAVSQCVTLWPLYLNPFTLGLLVSYAYLLQLLYRFAPTYQAPPAPSNIHYNSYISPRQMLAD